MKIMKRANNLCPRILSHANLELAFWKAQRGKGPKSDIAMFRARLDRELALLLEELSNHSITFGDYRFFTIRDPKERRICAAAFRERVLHHAIMNVCEPVLERYAIFDSYACRKGKGLYKALSRAQQFARRYAWFLKLDIKSYYDSIDHEVLLDQLGRLFKERDLMELFAKIVKSHSSQNDSAKRHNAARGLPIGNLTSQHFANLYLGKFDHFVKEELRVRGYVRYMDDFVIFGDSKANLRCVLAKAREFLSSRRQLSLRADVRLGPTARGFDFLGYRLFPDRIRLARRSKKRYARKLRDYEWRFQMGEFDEATLARRVECLTAFTRHADSIEFRRVLLAKSMLFDDFVHYISALNSASTFRKPLAIRAPFQHN